jgi:hypothetical protein
MARAYFRRPYFTGLFRGLISWAYFVGLFRGLISWAYLAHLFRAYFGTRMFPAMFPARWLSGRLHGIPFIHSRTTSLNFPSAKQASESIMRTSSFLSIAAILVSFMGASAYAASANTCSAASPAHRAALVELYTSEGCNSCPPADKWLSQLDQARKTSAVVPLELHVDYWDGPGWKDRFAQPTFTERQQRLSSKGGGNVVYTPEVFVGGREMRGWSSETSFESRIEQLNSEAPLADIHIDAHSTTPGKVAFNAAFQARSTLPDDAVAYAAVFEDKLESDVKGGENEGATLHHDRVVRRWIGPVRIVGGRAQISGDYTPGAMPQGMGVVAFVENAATGEVLQVAELPGCAS